MNAIYQTVSILITLAERNFLRTSSSTIWSASSSTCMGSGSSLGDIEGNEYDLFVDVELAFELEAPFELFPCNFPSVDETTVRA